MWIRLDDQVTHHPKFVRAGATASWLFVGGLAYCARYLTDGFIPAEALGTLTTIPKPERWVDPLVNVGLWTKAPGGWQVHDYHTYQPSRDEVERRREQRRQAGRIGGRRSGEARRQATDEAEPEANTKRVASQRGAFSRSKQEAETNPVPDPVPLVPQSEQEGALSLPLVGPVAMPGPDALQVLWNEVTTPPLPRCRELTARRRAHCTARLKDRPLDEWRRVFELAEASSFLRGENDRGWKADFGWFMESSEPAVKVLEGKYADRVKPVPPPQPPCQYRHTPPCANAADCTKRYLAEQVGDVA